ncbi:MAG: phage shock protein C [Candidatus Azotimanducaceae bacterium]|jgi:phage shock protein C
MKKKLYRNTEHKLVAGVLAGFADYYEQDVVFWRLLFVISLILTGLMPGLLIYAVCWIVIPERPTIEPVDAADYTVLS